MATVNIPWFTGYEGGQNLYLGRPQRRWQQLQGLAQGAFDIGYLLRKERSKGLPQGATDEDLAQQEQKLEAQLGESQAKARDDATHGVERHTVAGDAPAAEAVKNDPVAYAAQGHEEKQGLFPKLGNFMVEGVKRLAFGDPRRGERLSHIRQMEGELQAEKDRENFAKNVGGLCMKTEDPDACLRSMDPRNRFRIGHLPKMAQKPTAAQQAAEPDKYGVEPPPKGMGGLQQRMDYQEAERRVRERHGGTMPPPDVAAGEVDEEFEKIQTARRARIAKERSDRSRSDFDYRQASIAARQAQRDLANRIAKQGTTVTESWSVWRDVNQKEWQISDDQAQRLMRQFPNFGLVKVRKGTRETLPAPDRPVPRETPAAPPPAGEPPPADQPPVDEGERDFGVPFFFEVPQQ